MMTAHSTSSDALQSATAVRAMLRDIGYVMWLSQLVAAEIEQHQCQLIRPEMSDYCEFETAAFAA